MPFELLPEPPEDPRWIGGFESFVFTLKAEFVRSALLLSVLLAADTLALDCSTRRNSVAALFRLAGSFTVWLDFLLLSFSALCEGFVLGFWTFWAEAVIINPAITNASIAENFICFP